MCYADWKATIKSGSLNALISAAPADPTNPAQASTLLRERLPGTPFPGRKPKVLRHFYQLFSRGRLIPSASRPEVGAEDVLFISRNGGMFEQEGYVDSNAIRLSMERETSRPLPFATKSQHLTVPVMFAPFFTGNGTMHVTTEVQAEHLYRKRVLVHKQGYVPQFFQGVDWVEDGNHMCHLYMYDDAAPVKLLNPDESEEDFELMAGRVEELAAKGVEAASSLAVPTEVPTVQPSRGRPSWASLDPLPGPSETTSNEFAFKSLISTPIAGRVLPPPDLGSDADEPVYGD